MEKMDRELRVKVPEILYESVQLKKGDRSISEFVRIAIENQCDGRLDKILGIVEDIYMNMGFSD